MTVGWLVPPRQRGVELLDDPSVPDAVRDESLADVARSNVLFGGRRAVLAELDAAFRAYPDPAASFLDVGTGVGDLALAAARRASVHGIALGPTCVDLAPSLVRRVVQTRRADSGAAADARALPFADGAFEFVLCSQLLHHFEDADARRVLAELDRVAARRVIVADIRRSRVAALAFAAGATALRFHPVTRHDGYVSVLRGFTTTELSRLVHEATGVRAPARRYLGWRVAISWTPSRFARP